MKISKYKIRIALLALSTMQMASNAITPGLANIAKYFPNETSAAIQLLISLPALLVVPFALFSGWIVTVLPKKTLLLTGVLLIALSGLAPIFLDNYTLIIVTRIIMGIGVGLIMPIAPSVITDYFHGDELNATMGLFGAFACFGGIFNSLVGGLLAAAGWRYNFLVYLITVPVFILAMLFLPNDEKVKAVKSEKVRIQGRVFYISFICLLFTTAKFAFTMNISMFMSEENLGDAAMTGIIASVYTAGGFVAGFVFGKIAKIFKNYTLGAGMLFSALGMFMLFTAGDLIILFIGAFFVGTALSVVIPRFNVMITEAASPKSLALSLAICMAVMNLGQFAAPIVFNTLGDLFGFTTKRGQFLLATVALLLLGVGSLIVNYIKNKKMKAGISTLPTIES